MQAMQQFKTKDLLECDYTVSSLLNGLKSYKVENANLFSPVEPGNPLTEDRIIPAQSPDRMREFWSVKSI
jgi:hypothetical protein